MILASLIPASRPIVTSQPHLEILQKSSSPTLLYRRKEGRKAVGAMPSLEMARSKRKANPTVLVIFHLRATLAAEHRDSSAIPFKKAPRAPSRRSRRKRWKIIQVKWFSLMWLWQNLVLSLKLYLDWKSCSRAIVVNLSRQPVDHFSGKVSDGEGSDSCQATQTCAERSEKQIFKRKLPSATSWADQDTHLVPTT